MKLNLWCKTHGYVRMDIFNELDEYYCPICNAKLDLRYEQNDLQGVELFKKLEQHFEVKK